MAFKYYLSIDIGASSGRHILGHVENGKLVLEEVYRFKNGAVKKDGKLVWDHNALFESIVAGLKECGVRGKIPCLVGIDTWGVDYALLDKDGALIDEIYSYRDERTLSVIEEVGTIIGEQRLYERTGIQKQVFNTIYQLYCDKKSGKLDKAEYFLMMPDYLHYMLTGVKKNEYTNASTTGLLNAGQRDWDMQIIEELGLKKQLFKPLSQPGTIVGEIKPEIAEKVGFTTRVCLPATHDTASAVMAVPASGMPLYISSGTWSLMGVEIMEENTSDKAKAAGFTNEGGYDKSVRFLKNIMGLWMIQNIKKELNDEYSFAQLVEQAEKCADFKSIVQVNDISFFSPDSMTQAVKDYCKKTGQQVPQLVGELATCVYASLAESYRETTLEIEQITGKTFDAINIVGGGCQNEYLNKLTAIHTGKKVITGPVEATATGNILALMLAEGDIKSLAEGRNLVEKSFDIKQINA